MKLSLAITSYNRYVMTVESFAQVIDDPRIDDIVILDDASTDGSYLKLVDHFKGNEKVRIIRQAKNRGMLVNKFDAVSHAKRDWVILLDSDNKIDTTYVDAIFQQVDNVTGDPPLYADAIYMPEFARPNFDYRKFAGKMINKWNVKGIMSDSMCQCLLNTCNYVVYKPFYTKVFENNKDIQGTDTLWFNYLWLKSGRCFFVVPGMQYDHLVHDGSTWKEHANYNMKKAEEIRKLIMQL